MANPGPPRVFPDAVWPSRGVALLVEWTGLWIALRRLGRYLGSRQRELPLASPFADVYL